MKRIKFFLSIFLCAVLVFTAHVPLIQAEDDSLFGEDDPLIDEDDFSFDEAVIYFLLTDRFHNGDSTNDDPNGEGYDISHPETYHGGDLQGIIDKLDYLQDLGVNTIWISPIVDNINHNARHGNGVQYGYHGYWAKDFTKVDEHFGDVETLKRLVEEVHARGMKLMLDVVINHTGYGLKETDKNPGISNYPQPEEQAAFSNMLRLEPETGLIRGELAGLPDFITEDSVVLDKIITWQKEWLDKARSEDDKTIDYFRVDTTKHVELEELREFKDKIVEIEPEFKMMAEYFDGDIFQNGKVLENGGMDSVLDFTFKDIAKLYTRGKFTKAEKKLRARNQKLSEDKTAAQFLSSHDEHGFLKMKLNGDEELFLIAATIQLTAKGQPVIYYGEEIGLSGKNAGDMDKGEYSENRYDFEWRKTKDNPILDHYKKLLDIRKRHSDIFSKGNRQSLYINEENGVSVFSRQFEGKTVIVAINITDENQSIFLPFEINAKEITDIYAQVEYTAIEEKTDKSSIEIVIPPKSEGGTAIFYLDAE